MALENADAYYLDQDGIIKFTENYWKLLKFTDNLLLYKEKLHKEE